MWSMDQGSDRCPAFSATLKNGENGENGRCRATWSEVTLGRLIPSSRVSGTIPLYCASTGGVPDLRTERGKMPMSPASDPSTGSGLLWTGKSAGHAPALAHAGRLQRV